MDFLPTGPLDREALEREKARLAKIAEATRTCQATVDGQPRDFRIFFQQSYKTNGGWMFDILVRARPAATPLPPHPGESGATAYRHYYCV